MITQNYVRKQQYYDSVFLMRLAKLVSGLAGVEQVSAGMGTPLNKATLEELQLLQEAGRQAGPNDLIIAVAAVDELTAEKVRDELLRLLTAKQTGRAKSYQSLESLCREVDDLNLAVISVAGEFAGAEAQKALEQGMNVYMFSDNVPLEEEVALKRFAQAKGLLMMGPSCGLCFINGVAIGLCSKVRRGKIGMVGASGSGMQEVMTLIHRRGGGISQAVGVGSRDLSAAVGGVMMVQGLQRLATDPQTEVIVLIAKPPAPTTLPKVLDVVKTCPKPVVIQFIGGDPEVIRASGAIPSATFAETAERALALAAGLAYQPQTEVDRLEKLRPIVAEEISKFAPAQQYLRGIFCGGALAEEALTLVREVRGESYSNVAFTKEYQLADPFASYQNTIIDIGTEEFTRGRPHVAIDPTLRVARFVKEARDPETAVILLDFLLGYALHEDPAGVMAGAIKAEKAQAAREGRYLCVIASLCGSDLDPQGYEAQKAKLAEAGVIVTEDNGTAARLTAALVKKLGEAGLGE